MDDYTTADILARTSGSRGLTERERRRMMQRERAGLDLMAEDERALENDIARRGAVSGEVADAGLGLLAEATGVPSIIRGGQNIARAYDEGDGLRGAGGAGQVAMGLIPGGSLTRAGGAALRAAYSSLPRAGAAGAAMTLPMAMVESAEAQQAKRQQQNSNWPTTTRRAPAEPAPAAAPSADPLAGLVAGNPTLEARYKLLMQKEADAKASIPGVNRASSDSIRQKASEEAAQIRSELLAAIDKANADKKSADTAEENKNKSVREIYAEYMPYIPVATSILGGIGGGIIKGMYGRAHNAATANVSDSWKRAVEAGDKTAAQTAQAEMQALLAKGPGGTVPATAFGGTLGLHNALLPEEIDLARAQPDSKLAKDVWNRLTDAGGMAKRLGFGAIAGAAPAFSTAEITGALMKRSPQTYGPETASLASKYTQQGSADVMAKAGYEAAQRRAMQDAALDRQSFGQKFAENNITNRGLLSVADENAQGLIAGAAGQRQLDAAARQSALDAARTAVPVPPAAGASAAQSAGPPVPPTSVQSPPRQLPPPEPAQNPLPLPQKQPRQWANIWSDPARASVQQFIKENPGVPLEALSAPMLRGMIIARLPAGAPQPSAALVRDRLSKLKDAAGRGTVTTQRDIAGLLSTDPRRSMFSVAGPAIGAGMGLGLMSDWPGQ